MTAGELGVDYVFFGMLDRAEDPQTHPKSLDLADWWVPVFAPPCVIMAGSALESVSVAAETGADFIAVRDAIWDAPHGPAAAIAEANRLIAAAPALGEETA